MARAKKEYRELTVSEATNYGRKTAPMLRIQGQWFQELGFNIGDPVLEEETGKLQERFQKEKKALRAKFVAERQADYCMVAEAGSEA